MRSAPQQQHLSISFLCFVSSSTSTNFMYCRFVKIRIERSRDLVIVLSQRFTLSQRFKISNSSLFVRSFVCSFVGWFVRWLVRSFVGWFVRSLVRWFVGSFVGSLVRSFVGSLVGSFVRLFVCLSFVCSFVCSFVGVLCCVVLCLFCRLVPSLARSFVSFLSDKSCVRRSSCRSFTVPVLKSFVRWLCYHLFCSLIQ